MGIILPVANAGVIAMGVRDDGARDWAPGIDIDISRFAIETFRPELYAVKSWR